MFTNVIKLKRDSHNLEYVYQYTKMNQVTMIDGSRYSKDNYVTAVKHLNHHRNSMWMFYRNRMLSLRKLDPSLPQAQLRQTT